MVSKTDSWQSRWGYGSQILGLISGVVALLTQPSSIVIGVIGVGLCVAGAYVCLARQPSGIVLPDGPSGKRTWRYRPSHRLIAGGLVLVGAANLVALGNGYASDLTQASKSAPRKWMPPEVSFEIVRRVPANHRFAPDDWSKVFNGDRLRVKCTANSKTHLMVVMVESGGPAYRLMLPNNDSQEVQSRTLRAQEVVLLPSSKSGWEFDGATGLEAVFVIGSADQISDRRTNDLLERLTQIAHRGIRGTSDVPVLDSEYWEVLRGQVGSFLSNIEAAYTGVILQHEASP